MFIKKDSDIVSKSMYHGILLMKAYVCVELIFMKFKYNYLKERFRYCFEKYVSLLL